MVGERAVVKAAERDATRRIHEERHATLLVYSVSIRARTGEWSTFLQRALRCQQALKSGLKNEMHIS